MGRDSGDSARLLARLTGGAGGLSATGWSDGDGVLTARPGSGQDDDVDPFPAGLRRHRTGAGGRHGRHVDEDRVDLGLDDHVDGHVAGGRRVDPDDGPGASGRGQGWRITGVPPGLAVLLLGVAVVGVLLLGRGGGSDEVLVGPAGTGLVADQASSPDGVGPGATGPGDPGVVGEVVTGPDGGLPDDGGPEDGSPDGVAAGPGQGAGPGDGAAVAATAGPLLVHVDGAVERPGVVELPPGARVGDAVLAAGGATDEADTRLVNLARPLTDGELVVVPRPGEQPQPGQGGPGTDAATGPAAAGAPAAGAPAADAPAGAGTAGGPVDLNTADAATLDGLPGIGPVLAERIVAWRAESGPFVSVDDLTAVSGIGPAVLSDVRDLVTV